MNGLVLVIIDLMVTRLKNWAEILIQETMALYFAYRDPRTPWYARLFTAYVFARTVSPVDLIPDFIPVIGYMDDLILTPVGIWLAIKIIPKDVLEDSRNKARETSISNRSSGNWYIFLVILFWIIFIAAIGWAIFPIIHNQFR